MQDCNGKNNDSNKLCGSKNLEEIKYSYTLGYLNRLNHITKIFSKEGQFKLKQTPSAF